MAYRVGSVKKNLKPFKAFLHYGDASNLPMHTVSFHGNQYDLNVLIRQAEAEGEPLRVQKEPSRRAAVKRKRAGAKKRTVSRLRASKRGRGYGVMRHGVSASRAPQQHSYSAGPYSEYGPAHEKALRIESAGGRGMRIDKRRGGWYVSYVSPEALH